MRMLKFTLICGVAIVLMIGCTSEKQVEQTGQAASTKASAPAITTTAYQEVTLNVTGMTCGGCQTKVQSALANVPGVISADVSHADGKAVVKLEKGKATDAQLTDAVKQAGFSAQTTN
jgi:copper chaperone CopZ